MPYNQIPLELDITGKNINNKIVDEPHTLSNRPVRSIAPKLGPFFAESLQVKEGINTLIRGTDYQIVELHQEATLKYGKEISSVILVINKNIGSNVTITYQALGGHYTYNSNAIANMYQSVINDNRPVNWTNIVNKPSEFNPTIHRHLLDDVFGFEPIVDHLERIKRAITLGQVNVVLEIIKQILSEFKCKELPKILPNNKLVEYDALLYFLSRRKILNNIWIDKKDCIWVKGTSVIIQIDTTGYPNNTTLYWEFYVPNLDINLPFTSNNSFKTNNNIIEISIYIPTNFISNTPIYLGIKENLNDIEYKAVTYKLDVNDSITTDSIYSYLLYDSNEDLSYPFVNEASLNDELRLYYQIRH